MLKYRIEKTEKKPLCAGKCMGLLRTVVETVEWNRSPGVQFEIIDGMHRFYAALMEAVYLKLPVGGSLSAPDKTPMPVDHRIFDFRPNDVAVMCGLLDRLRRACPSEALQDAIGDIRRGVQYHASLEVRRGLKMESPFDDSLR